MIFIEDPSDLESFHTSIHEYLNSKLDYQHKIQTKQWQSMECYLLHYNLMDARILCNAFMAFVNEFIQAFNISPLDSISMPSLASKISWKSYDPDCYAIFSFGKDYGFLNDDIRKFGLNGGLVSKFYNCFE